MKRALTLLLAVGLLSTAPLVRSQAPQSAPALPSATIEVDVSKPAHYKIPRTIFGTFLEPIGNSTYGGLWADLLENPSLEEGLWSAANFKKILDEQPTLLRSSELGLPLPWEPLSYDQQNRFSSWAFRTQKSGFASKSTYPSTERAVSSVTPTSSCSAVRQECPCQFGAATTPKKSSPKPQSTSKVPPGSPTNFSSTFRRANSNRSSLQTS
jgi:hypothetical protein